MPLHLLHHKSYHVYNAENIARVRRDEAEAAAAATTAADVTTAREAAERMKLLRARAAGEPDPEPEPEPEPATTSLQPAPRHKTASQRRIDQQVDRSGLVGADGRFNLFPTQQQAGNDEVATEKRAREQRWEDENLGNALGRVARDGAPWYAGGAAPAPASERRERRQQKHQEWADPLRVVRWGVQQVRNGGRERDAWRRAREREVGPREWETPGDRRGPEKTPRRRSSSRSPAPEEPARRQRRSKSRSPALEKPARRQRRSRSRSPALEKSARRRKRSRSRGGASEADARLAKLRAEREEREAQEQARAAVLLRARREKELLAEEPGWVPAKGGRYSRQFGGGGGS